MNEYHLQVLDDLKNNPYFYKENNLIRYLIPDERENIDNKDIGRKVTAVLDLRDWGVFEINNNGETLISSIELKYEFYLKLKKQVFDDIYRKCVNEVKSLDVPKYENQLLTTQNIPTLRSKLKDVIIKNKIRGKYQTALINELSDFQLHNTKDLNKKVGAKFLEGIKCELKNKLKKTGFDIKGERGKDITQSGWYKLTFGI